MELICYLHPGWRPLIRPAPATRPWMDATPEAFAYRCLPLDIANAHGWEVLCPCGFEAMWTGQAGTDAVTIRLDPDATGAAPVSLFGQGVVTFHIEGIIRTPPGWDLWIGGSPNRGKDAIAPLGGVVETDWSPFTFTMNWRFTRPDQWVRFEPLEPICFFFPVQRGVLETFAPKFAPMTDDPKLLERFTAWSEARDAFHTKMSREPPRAGADKWQKHYYRGVDVHGTELVEDHRAKLRLRPFERDRVPDTPLAPTDDRGLVSRPPTATSAAHASDRAARDLRRREWLLEAMERQRLLSAAASGIARRSNLGQDEFLERYYAPGRPVVLTGEMAGWPALARWTPSYLAQVVGPRRVEFEEEPTAGCREEADEHVPRRETPFDDFIRQASGPGAAISVHLVTSGSTRNAKALAPLGRDLGKLDKYLTPSADGFDAKIRIEPAGALTVLHHDLANVLIAPAVGRKRLKLLPPSEVGRLYNSRERFSEIADLEDPAVQAARYPRLNGARIYDIQLSPGEIAFVPVGWWYQATALDFSVTLAYDNFIWPNDAAATYPRD